MYRHTLLFIAFLLLSSSVSRASLYPVVDASLLPVAENLRKKEYSAARDAALKAPPSPERDFALGVAAYRLERWDEAERFLAGGVDGVPLLGDFSLYYRATALSRLSRFDEALPLLDRLKKDYPESPLLRSALLLSADTLFQKGDFQGALTSYRRFTETYTSGNDALKALHRAALCRERLGDPEGAARELRAITLAHPGKGITAEADADLARLGKQGAAVLPYTGEELLKRGLILFEQRSYRDAAAALSSISPESLPEHLRGHLSFKTALALYRAKRNREAEEALARLSSPDTAGSEYAVEACYWHACSLDRNGKDKEAEAAFLKLAATNPSSDLADDALFQAALLRKNAGDHREALTLFRRIQSDYPASSHVPRALWEISWSLYLSGDYEGAADTFGRLAGNSAYREKALYWKGRSLAAAGSLEAARQTHAVLLEEYPAGFYSLNIEKETGTRNSRIPVLNRTHLSSLPLPDGHDRAKALISLGLYEEARMELRAVRKRSSAKSRNSMDFASLYLAMEDYNSAMGLFPQSALLRRDKNTQHVWGIVYPAAFSEIVARHTSNVGIAESLVFALIRAESNFSPTARSSVGALGLMQLMPATAKATAKDMHDAVTPARLTHPDLNISLGTRHLKYLLTRFNGNIVSAVAAYNAGATPVTRWRKNFAGLREDEFIENIPYPETREYVKKVLAAMEVYRRLYRSPEPAPSVANASTAVQKALTSAGMADVEQVTPVLPQ